MSSSRSRGLDALTRAVDDPRSQIRRKALALFDLFELGSFERGIVVSRLEKGLRETSEEKILEALRILRE